MFGEHKNIRSRVRERGEGDFVGNAQNGEARTHNGDKKKLTTNRVQNVNSVSSGADYLAARRAANVNWKRKNESSRLGSSSVTSPVALSEGGASGWFQKGASLPRVAY